MRRTLWAALSASVLFALVPGDAAARTPEGGTCRSACAQTAREDCPPRPKGADVGRIEEHAREVAQLAERVARESEAAARRAVGALLESGELQRIAEAAAREARGAMLAFQSDEAAPEGEDGELGALVGRLARDVTEEVIAALESVPRVAAQITGDGAVAAQISQERAVEAEVRERALAEEAGRRGRERGGAREVAQEARLLRAQAEHEAHNARAVEEEHRELERRRSAVDEERRVLEQRIERIERELSARAGSPATAPEPPLPAQARRARTGYGYALSPGGDMRIRHDLEDGEGIYAVSPDGGGRVWVRGGRAGVDGAGATVSIEGSVVRVLDKDGRTVKVLDAGEGGEIHVDREGGEVRIAPRVTRVGDGGVIELDLGDGVDGVRRRIPLRTPVARAPEPSVPPGPDP